MEQRIFCCSTRRARGNAEVSERIKVQVKEELVGYQRRINFNFPHDPKRILEVL